MKYLLKFNENSNPDMVLSVMFDILEEASIKYEVKKTYVTKDYVGEEKPMLSPSEEYNNIVITLPEAASLQQIIALGQFCERFEHSYDSEKVKIWCPAPSYIKDVYIEISFPLEKIEPKVDMEKLKNFLTEFINPGGHYLRLDDGIWFTDHPHTAPGYPQKSVIQFDPITMFIDKEKEYKELVDKYFSDTDGYNFIYEQDGFWFELYIDKEKDDYFFVCETNADTKYLYSIIEDISIYK